MVVFWPVERTFLNANLKSCFVKEGTDCNISVPREIFTLSFGEFFLWGQMSQP